MMKSWKGGEDIVQFPWSDPENESPILKLPGKAEYLCQQAWTVAQKLR